MEVKTKRESGVLIVQVEGRMDGITAREFEDAMKAAISASDHAVIVDLEVLSYISSAGLRAILPDRQGPLESGCEICAQFAPSPRSGRSLKLPDLTRLLRFMPPSPRR